MRLVRGFVIFAVGALLAVPFAVLMLLVFPRQTAGSEAAALQQVVALLFGGPLCLAIGVLLITYVPEMTVGVLGLLGKGSAVP